VTRTAVLLFLSSCTTAVLHALIPDHWLPFVLMSRAQRWGARRAAALTGLAGLLHVLVSIAVGGAAILLGSTSARSLAERTGESLDFLGGLLLVIFGLLYGTWTHLREARVHGGTTASRQEGPRVHTHGHLLERWFHGALSGAALVVIIGISPCALMVPILFTAAAQGAAAVLATGVGFAICTIGTMVGVTLFALRGMQRFDLPFLTRYGDLMSGVLIAVIGFLVMLLEG
jgi:hypothetical protein